VHPASSVVSSGIIEQRSVAGLSFGVIAWSAWIRYEHGANLQIEKHLAGSGVITKQTDPFRFFGKFKWIDGAPVARQR